METWSCSNTGCHSRPRSLKQVREESSNGPNHIFAGFRLKKNARLDAAKKRVILEELSDDLLVSRDDAVAVNQAIPERDS
jgi:hypothetical protein